MPLLGLGDEGTKPLPRLLFTGSCVNTVIGSLGQALVTCIFHYEAATKCHPIPIKCIVLAHEAGLLPHVAALALHGDVWDDLLGHLGDAVGGGGVVQVDAEDVGLCFLLHLAGKLEGENKQL